MRGPSQDTIGTPDVDLPGEPQTEALPGVTDREIEFMRRTIIADAIEMLDGVGRFREAVLLDTAAADADVEHNEHSLWRLHAHAPELVTQITRVLLP